MTLLSSRRVEDLYREYTQRKLDISEHLPTLLKYAKKCDIIVEFGVRDGISTTAFLMARPKRLLSYDIIITPKALKLQKMALAENINFELIEADDCLIKIPKCDLLFIDTVHTGRQITNELRLHGNKTQKYIILHDTVTYGLKGEVVGTEGLLFPLFRFLQKNTHWKIRHHYINNNGLTIIKRYNG